MTAYTKDEREAWVQFCAAPIAYGEGDRSFGSEGDEARYSAELADAKLEEYRKRFVPEAAEESCARCKWHDGDSCKRFTEDNAYVCISNSLAWFAEKETDR